MTTTTDLIGTPISEDEAALLNVYDALTALAGRELAPAIAANVRDALASTAIAVTDLGLRYEHLIDLGV
ncbi:MAG: hypothetical protein JWO18_2723 [Microbacteriaceae bacterium]|nr:hypothetical protein [Microbacteriaceae bacterium]